jgi:hypothetical protein
MAGYAYSAEVIALAKQFQRCLSRMHPQMPTVSANCGNCSRNWLRHRGLL